MGLGSVVTPAGANRGKTVALSAFRDDVHRVLNGAIVLVGLFLLEALFNFLNRNVLGGLVAILGCLIPACGWHGSKRRRTRALKWFYVVNAACAVFYVVGVLVNLGLVIPARRCHCEPACKAASVGLGVAPPSGGVALDTMGDEAHMQFHGAVDEVDLLDSAPSALCTRAAFLGLYASAMLSVAAAAVHAYCFTVGRRLHRAVVRRSSPPVAAGPAASTAAPGTGVLLSGPASSSSVGPHAPPRSGTASYGAYLRGPASGGRGRGCGSLDVEGGPGRAFHAPSVASPGMSSLAV